MLSVACWQRDMQLFGNEAALSLPQDEATAAVMIAAILARNIEDDRWPGEYWASVHSGVSDPIAVVSEGDPRVAAARTTLNSFLSTAYFGRQRRDFTPEELGQARDAVLAMAPG